MPKARKPQTKSQQLLVEGKNDRHVIWALCLKYELPKNFSVEVINPEDKPDEAEREDRGIEELLKYLPAKLDEENLETLGIVVDADIDLEARWQALSNKLNDFGYKDIPKKPQIDGWIDTQPELPKIGIWVMPNNQLPGMLEDFVSYLIPPDDEIKPEVEAWLENLEAQKINPYSEARRAKAFIHTWLAVQKKPGMPMGQAITARALSEDAEVVKNFIEWLNRLFAPEP